MRLSIRKTDLAAAYPFRNGYISKNKLADLTEDRGGCGIIIRRPCFSVSSNLQFPVGGTHPQGASMKTSPEKNPQNGHTCVQLKPVLTVNFNLYGCGFRWDDDLETRLSVPWTSQVNVRNGNIKVLNVCNESTDVKCIKQMHFKTQRAIDLRRI